MSDEEHNQSLAKLRRPILTKKKKSDIYSSSSSLNSSYCTSDDSASSGAEESLTFYCRFCSTKTKSATPDRQPQDEVCKNCAANYPERMFCKSCKRYFPHRKPFTKSKDRCKFCYIKLERAREARKRKKEEEDTNNSLKPKDGKKKKEEEEEGRKKTKKQEESYICLYVRGQCIVKKYFETE